MFEASVNGDLYDPAKWGAFYKPYGLDVGTKTQATVAPAQTVPATPTESVAPVVTAPAPAVAETTAPVVETTAPVTAPAVAEPVATAPAEDTGKKSADDILNMIRNRQSS